MESKTSLTTKERESFRRELRQELEKFVREEIRRQLGDKVTQQQTQEICGEVLLKFFRTLTSRPTFWK